MNKKTGKIIICITCGTEKYKSKYDLQKSGNPSFCSSSCFSEWRQNEYIIKWKNGEVSGTREGWRNGKKSPIPSGYVRTYLFKQSNNSCSLCGWNKVNKYNNKSPLEIDHIDGNPLNNVPDNLRIICPNCHSLTSTYRGTKRK